MRNWFVRSDGRLSRVTVWWVVFCVTLSTVVLVAQLFGWIG